MLVLVATGLGIGVGVLVLVATGLGIGVGVLVLVATGTGVGVGMLVLVATGAGVGVGVLVLVATEVGVGVGVLVLVTTRVGVRVTVGLALGLAVPVDTIPEASAGAVGLSDKPGEFVGSRVGSTSSREDSAVPSDCAIGVTAEGDFEQAAKSDATNITATIGAFMGVPTTDASH